MEHRELDFKPLNFQKTLHDELRPPIFDGDNSFGDAYATGELLSLRHAKNALLIVVRFSPGPDANQVGWHSPYGEVEFLLLEQKGYYVGGIIVRFRNISVTIVREMNTWKFLGTRGRSSRRSEGGARLDSFASFPSRVITASSLSLSSCISGLVGLADGRKWWSRCPKKHFMSRVHDILLSQTCRLYGSRFSSRCVEERVDFGLCDESAESRMT